MAESSYENTNMDWKAIYLSLYAYTFDLVKKLSWFRGKRTGAFLEGKTVDDYVCEAITRYLEHPEKFDPSKGTSLITYLKRNLIRGLVSNDVTSKENRVTSNVFALADEISEDGGDSSLFLDSVLPYAEALFDDEIDFDNITKEIENEISGNDVLENIYLGIRVYGMTRREVMEEFGLTPKDYDNGIRRLTTVLERIAKKYHI